MTAGDAYPEAPTTHAATAHSYPNMAVDADVATAVARPAVLSRRLRVIIHQNGSPIHTIVSRIPPMRLQAGVLRRLFASTVANAVISTMTAVHNRASKAIKR